MQYNIELTAAEDAALSSVTYSQDEWIQNAVHERCRVAIDAIVQVAVAKCLEAGIQIPSSKEDMVTLAFSEGWVKTAVQQHEEALAAAEALKQAENVTN